MTPIARARWPQQGIAWALAIVGFVGIFAPVYWHAASGLWQSDEQAHGPIVLIAVAWLLWRRRRVIGPQVPQPAAAPGWACVAVGALMYVVGRSQDATLFELGAQIPMAAGMILLLAGPEALQAARFPLGYAAFALPLPAAAVDALTGPLKQWISAIAEDVLYAAGYPIARTGVILIIGPYQLLVADACSGLHSIFSLSALGLLFMHLAKRPGMLHNAIMVASILPIAFAANAIRVMTLVLVTYHLGDRAAQSFLHGLASIVLFSVAMLLFFALDAALARTIGPMHLRSTVANVCPSTSER